MSQESKPTAETTESLASQHHFGVNEIERPSSFKDYLGVYFRGMAMGAADVVPGVSGGTIALITGIYDRFIHSLKLAGSVQTFHELRRLEFKALIQRIDGIFLMSLLMGIMTSVFTLSGLITYLMEFYPHPLWAFFIGLVFASAGIMFKDMKRQGPIGLWPIMMLIIGFALAFSYGRMSQHQLDVQNWHFFAGGAFAICAMMLPGISGSFLLLMIGLYGPVLEAVHNLAFFQIGLFATGCMIGLLSFSHVLSWFLSRFPQMSYAFLIGLMLGTVEILWPWKEVISTRTKSDGAIVPLIEKAISPFEFQRIYEASANIEISLVAFGVAIVGIYFLGRKDR